MKNCKKIATLFLAAALFIGFAMPNHASAKGPRDQAQWLESLSADQRASAKKIMEGKAAHMQELHQQLEAKRSELDSLRKSKDPDTQAIERLSAEIGAIRGKILACRATMKAELRAAGLPVDQMRKAPELNGKAPAKRAPRLNDELSADQKARAQAILDQHMAETGQTRDALAAKNAALAEAMAAQSPDTAKIEQLSREIGELRGQIAVKRIELRKKFAEAGLPKNTLAKKQPRDKHGNGDKFRRGDRPDMEEDAPRKGRHERLKDGAPLEQPAAEGQAR